MVKIHMREEVESMTQSDLEEIRQLGSRMIRNLSLMMDNPFQYMHLIDSVNNDLNELSIIKQRCNIKGDGLLPAEPIGRPQNQDLRQTLLDAGFARLRGVVDDMISGQGGINHE